MNKRVKELRKILGLSGEKFGYRLGLKRSAISKIENDLVTLSESNIKSICREFNVNEDWLRTGQGNMFNEDNELLLNDLVIQYNLSDIDIKILESYIKLSPDKRQVISNYLKSLNS